jgi:hypothetical protein
MSSTTAASAGDLAMNVQRRPPVAALIVAGLLALAAVPAAATHISMSFDHDIEIEGDDIVINADGDEAVVSADGELTVDGRRISMGERDRQALLLYNQALRRVKERGMEIGLQGAGLAVHALAEAFVAVTTGDERRAERRIEARAEDIKDSARELCNDVRTAEVLQEMVAERVPAFRPYAVIELDEDDCDVDD